MADDCHVTGCILALLEVWQQEPFEPVVVARICLKEHPFLGIALPRRPVFRSPALGHYRMDPLLNLYGSPWSEFSLIPGQHGTRIGPES